MDIRIKTITIRNFRSIADATLELSPGINVLAGANGSGKSNILKAMSRLSRKIAWSPNDQSRFSKDSFLIDVVTIAGDALRIEQQGIYQGNKPVSGFENNVFLMEALRGYREESLVPHIPNALFSDGSNLAGMLFQYKGTVLQPGDLERFLERARRITPEIDNIVPQFKGDDTARLLVKLRKDQESFMFPPECLSTGSLDAVFLVLALQVFGEGSLYLLDGPDSHLHAGSQESMLDLLREVAASESRQFVIATHSPFVVDLCSTDELFFVTREGFRTSVERVSDKKEIIEALESTDARKSEFASSLRKI
jgi:predicted ATPase